MLQKAISQLPRVEDRLLALMWSFADRRGIVRPDGIWVHLAITHDALAQMIGARRPTVSLGLKSLSAQGLLRPEADGWLIARASLAEFGSPDGASGTDQRQAVRPGTSAPAGTSPPDLRLMFL